MKFIYDYSKNNNSIIQPLEGLRKYRTHNHEKSLAGILNQCIQITLPRVFSSSVSASARRQSASLSSARRFRSVFSMHSISSMILSWHWIEFSNSSSAARVSPRPSIKSLKQRKKGRNGDRCQKMPLIFCRRP